LDIDDRFDVNGDGEPELIVGTRDGSLSARSLKTGDIVFGHRCATGDALETSVFAIKTTHQGVDVLLGCCSSGDGSFLDEMEA
jgi:hypothetical protein